MTHGPGHLLDFDLSIHVGLDDPGRCLGTFPIPAAGMDNVGSFAGSYHVLEMGRHYGDYMVRGHRSGTQDGVEYESFAATWLEADPEYRFVRTVTVSDFGLVRVRGFWTREILPDDAGPILSGFQESLRSLDP